MQPRTYTRDIERRIFIANVLALPSLRAAQRVEYTCPMHPDVRAGKPGACPRCRMALVPAGLDFVEYPLQMRVVPDAPRAGEALSIAFAVRHPVTGQRITQFQVMHEKLYHLFIVGPGLRYFAHVHPERRPDGTFRFQTTLPEPGMYRILNDFYPAGGMPQLVPKTILLPGAITATPALEADLQPKQCTNLQVALTTEPKQPLAGFKTLLFFDLNPAADLEPYLGAPGHMLAASADTVDMIHQHPFLDAVGPKIQFNLIFPRPGIYRVWVQFQRKGVVNTAVFNVPVSSL